MRHCPSPLVLGGRWVVAMAGTDDKDGEAKKLWFGGTLDDFKKASKLHDKVHVHVGPTPPLNLACKGLQYMYTSRYPASRDWN